MNILYFNDNFLPYRSGVTTFLENVSSFMADNNHNVTILVAKRNKVEKPFCFNKKINIQTLASVPSIFRYKCTFCDVLLRRTTYMSNAPFLR